MNKRLVAALAGNPNSGKTTLFNRLTGARQHVGNWPGVTVEKKEGTCKFKGHEIQVIDLPGVYSLSAYSPDEVVARDFIIDEKPDVVINIVDASNLERNLYLTVQLLEMEVPMVVVFNMMDQVESKGIQIDLNGIAGKLGVPVIPVTASRGLGIDDLLDRMLELVNGKTRGPHQKITYGKEVEKVISDLEKTISDSGLAEGYSSRWLAVKMLEGDDVLSISSREAVHV